MRKRGRATTLTVDDGESSFTGSLGSEESMVEYPTRCDVDNNKVLRRTRGTLQGAQSSDSPLNCSTAKCLLYGQLTTICVYRCLQKTDTIDRFSRFVVSVMTFSICWDEAVYKAVRYFRPM